MRLLDLDEDVLYHIIHYLTPSAALSLGKTSRYADLLTLSQRLYQVILRTAGAVSTFCGFCLADPRSRPPLILELTMDFAFPRTFNFDALCEVLRRAKKLRLLSLHWIVDPAVMCPALLAVLAQHTTITTLIIGNTAPCEPVVNQGIRKLLAHSASPITTLELGPWDVDSRTDVWVALASLSRTLEIFRVAGDPYSSQDPEWSNRSVVAEPPPGLVCEGLHTLHLRSSFAASLNRFSKFFPNVRTLRWDKRSSEFYDDGPLPAAHWPLLDFLVYDYSYYPPLSSCTQVRYMEIRHDLIDGPALLFESGAPVVLSWKAIGIGIREHIPLLAGGASRVRYLSFVEDRRCQGNTTLCDLMPFSLLYADAFAALQLQGLSLDLKVNCRGSVPTPNYNCDRALAAAAAAVATRIQTLQYVCIRGGQYDKKAQDIEGWFEVTSRNKEGAILRRLPAWEADAVEEKLLSLTI